MFGIFDFFVIVGLIFTGLIVLILLLPIGISSLFTKKKNRLGIPSKKSNRYPKH